MEEQNREDILKLYGDILGFTFNEVANNHMISVLKTSLSEEKETKILAITMLNKIFHDDRLVEALISSATNFGSWSSSRGKDVVLIGKKYPIGFRIYNHLTYGNRDLLQKVNQLDKTEYIKKYKRAKAILNKLKKINEKFS